MSDFVAVSEKKPRHGQKCLVVVWDDIYSAEYIETKSNPNGWFFPIYDALSCEKTDGYGSQDVRNAEFYEQPKIWMDMPEVNI